MIGFDRFTLRLIIGRRQLLIHSRRIFSTILLLILLSAQGWAQLVKRGPLAPQVFSKGEGAEVVRKVMKEVADGGNTGVVWESRPHPDYLGEGWWAELKVVFEEAKKHNLDVWIFDEYGFPSGPAGGRVIKVNPDYRHWIVMDRAVQVSGPQPSKVYELPGSLGQSEQVVSVVAFREAAGGRRDMQEPAGEMIDLTPQATDGGRQVEWAAMDGRWRICWSVTRPEGRGQTQIDVLNPKAVETFIRVTHEATYERLKDDFGKTLKGFFSDESSFRNVNSFRCLPGTPGIAMPWSPVFAEYFKKLKGYDPRPVLPALWYDIGKKGRQARFDLMDAYTKCFAETFFKPQQEWCKRHNVQLIGHLVEEDGADHQLGYGSGHWFRSMNYFDEAGIDVIYAQVTPGLDSGRYWVASWADWDQEFHQFGLPAMARGAALIKRSPHIVAETFGAYGWSEGLKEQKWIGDQHIVNGINGLWPHAVSLKYHNMDCPPHYNRTSGNPQWRYYSTWAEYFKRLQNVNWDTTPQTDAVVLYTAESLWMGPAHTVSSAVRLLEQRQVSTVVLPYEVFASEGAFENGKWVFNGQRFPAVVLPFVQYIPAGALKRLQAFAEAGGHVVVMDQWPVGSVDARGDDEVKAAVEAMKKLLTAHLVSLRDVASVVTAFSSMSLEPGNQELQVSRRSGPDGEWIFLHNRSLYDSATGRLHLRGAAGKVVRYDAELGKYFQIPNERRGADLYVHVDVPAYALHCLRIAATVPAGEAAVKFRTGNAVKARWSVAKASDDSAESFEPLGQRDALDDWRRWPGMEQYSGTVSYKAKIAFPKTARGESVGIDLGTVGEIAEVKVNGKDAGSRIAPPYAFDLTSLVRPGGNEIEILITNTGQARWTDPWQRGDATSGLLGPVRILRGNTK